MVEKIKIKSCLAFSQVSVSFFLVVLGLSISNCSAVHRKYVIFDTDGGADDSWALQLLLKSEKELQNVKILAITTVDGNTDIKNVIRNIYRILDGINRTDIPIYKGASESLVPVDTVDDNYFGKNGFSDVQFEVPLVKSIIQQKNAVEIIRELVLMYPKKVSILSLGPPTNIALAIKSYPEIKKYIREIFMMGGSIEGKGNILPGLEFNFYKDPDSTYIILHSSFSPITILTLDVQDHLHVTTSWRFRALDKIYQSNVQLLNEVEGIALKNEKYYNSMDFLAATAFLFPKAMIRTIRPYNATIELAGYNTRGRMIVDPMSTDYNVNIITKVCSNFFKRIILWTANY